MHTAKRLGGRPRAIRLGGCHSGVSEQGTLFRDGEELIEASPRCCEQCPRGRVAEWFKAAVLKTAMGASPSWVRIPPLPPAVASKLLDTKRLLEIQNSRP